MKLQRHFFISDDLDDLERLEEELEQAGIVTPQIHVLTRDDSGADHHPHLHKVVSLMKRDLVHSTMVGAAVGLCVSALIVLVVHFAGWADGRVGWLPFVFLAIIALGLCTWIGGLHGIDTPNVHFRQFEQALAEGKHIFFVDLRRDQSELLRRHTARHPRLRDAGTGEAAPAWLVFWQHRMKRFFVETFP